MASENNIFSSSHLHPNYAAAPATGEFPIPAENFNNNEIDVEYFNSFPPGYRFVPTEAELVLYYLKKKVNGQELPKSKIMDVNLYHYNPDKLAEQFKSCGEKEWYFFTPRNKKYRNGKRPNRAAGEGYWKATGSDKPVKYKGEVVGYKKSLVFYVGKAQKGKKTNWMMHEFRVVDAPTPQRKDQNDMKLDHWVLCKIYHKSDKSGTIPVLKIQQVQDEALGDATDDHMVIAANNSQQFNHNGVDFNQSFNDMNVYNENIPNVNSYFSRYNYQQQQQQQQLSSSGSSNPFANVLIDHYASPNLYSDQQQLSSNNSDLFVNITAECASLNLCSDHKEGNSGFDSEIAISESWAIVDYPKDGIYTDFNC